MVGKKRRREGKGADQAVLNDDGEDESRKHAAETEQYCKILTFNADGGFEWPASSPYKCWNCCHGFEGPPAMIPRHYNRIHKYYVVYGTFCGWACAKLFASDTNQEYFSDTAPSLGKAGNPLVTGQGRF